MKTIIQVQSSTPIETSKISFEVTCPCPCLRNTVCIRRSDPDFCDKREECRAAGGMGYSSSWVALCNVTETMVSCPRHTLFGCYWQTNFATCTTTGIQHSSFDPDLNLYFHWQFISLLINIYKLRCHGI